jgi:Family of unknown function (DUF6496)
MAAPRKTTRKSSTPRKPSAARKSTSRKSSTTRKYSPSSGSDVKSEMHRYKRGTAKSGPGGKAGKVKSRKQAIAIGLSKARKEGKKVPPKKKKKSS